MLLEELSTPCLLVEEKRLAANIERMQAIANKGQVSLRPHTKTHKSVAVARRQVEQGAKGITVAKVGEAEVYADAGFEDIRIAYCIVGADKCERIKRLGPRCNISFCVDTPEGARAASEHFADAPDEVEVLVEIDTGYGRCGVRWDHPDLVDFVKLVAALPGLKFVGLLTHAGNAYDGATQPGERPEDGVRRVATEESERILHAAERLQAEGLTPRDVSIGSTPTATFFESRIHGNLRVTEIRPGNYVYYDRTQVGLGVAKLEDCALTVLTTVISKHRDLDGGERLFLDAGKKVFTSDGAYGSEGFGEMLYNARTMTALPHATINKLSEEHGWVHIPGGGTLDVGDRARVVPNHACVTVNTQSRLVHVDGDEILGYLDVDARGRVT